MANPNRDRVSGVPQAQPLLAPNWWLGLVPREFWNKKKTFFIYETDFATAVGGLGGGSQVNLPASGQSTGNIQIQSDSHFLIVAGVALVTDATFATVLNSPSNANSTGILCQIVDVAAGFPLSNVPVPLESLFGTAQLPGVWSIPKLIRASSTLQTNLQNLIATARAVRLSYWGVRIYFNIPESRG